MDDKMISEGFFTYWKKCWIIVEKIIHYKKISCKYWKKYHVEGKGKWAIGPLHNTQLIPGLEKHGFHAMISPWSYHDHDETWSWSCHDDSMAAMFLGIVVLIHGMITMFSMIHTMIMVWSVLHAFSLKRMDFLSMLSQLVATLYHN